MTYYLFSCKNHEADAIIIISILQMSYRFIEKLSNLYEATQFVNGRGWKSNPGSLASDLVRVSPQGLSWSWVTSNVQYIPRVGQNLDSDSVLLIRISWYACFHALGSQSGKMISWKHKSASLQRRKCRTGMEILSFDPSSFQDTRKKTLISWYRPLRNSYVAYGNSTLEALAGQLGLKGRVCILWLAGMAHS